MNVQDARAHRGSPGVGIGTRQHHRSRPILGQRERSGNDGGDIHVHSRRTVRDGKDASGAERKIARDRSRARCRIAGDRPTESEYTSTRGDVAAGHVERANCVGKIVQIQEPIVIDSNGDARDLVGSEQASHRTARGTGAVAHSQSSSESVHASSLVQIKFAILDRGGAGVGVGAAAAQCHRSGIVLGQAAGAADYSAGGDVAGATNRE